MGKSIPLKTRLFNRAILNQETGCIEWTGAIGFGGYGVIQVSGKALKTHRVSYRMFVGELLPDMHIDHLCRNRACLRPDHLEQVTPGVNAMRGMAGKVRGEAQRAKTHCPRNHPYDEENTRWDNRGYRLCKPCTKILYRKRRDKARESVNALRQPQSNARVHRQREGAQASRQPPRMDRQMVATHRSRSERGEDQ